MQVGGRDVEAAARRCQRPIARARAQLEHARARRDAVEGRVLQAVDPQPGESVLEIGSGSGFLTACLAKLAGAVVGIEQHADFSAAANARLSAAGIANAQVETAEAVRGYAPKHQFDVMVVTGAVYELPQHWYGWIKPGGRIFAIAGQSPAQCATLHTQTAGSAWSATALFETDLPYLRNAEPPQRFSL